MTKMKNVIHKFGGKGCSKKLELFRYFLIKQHKEDSPQESILRGLIWNQNLI